MNYLFNLVTILLSFTFVSCATLPSDKDQELDRKIQAERRADTPEELAQRAAQVFADAPGLREDQREKLNKLYLRTYAESWAIRKEIGQMKSLMFKEAANRKFESKEMKELTRRVVAADQKRLQIMFAALQEMQQIVGYGPGKEELYEHLRDYEMPGNALR